MTHAEGLYAYLASFQKKDRARVVLGDLEGKTKEEAAEAAPLSPGAAMTWNRGSSDHLADGQVSREREQVEAPAVKPSGSPSRLPIRTLAEAPNSGSSTRRRCAWRRRPRPGGQDRRSGSPAGCGSTTGHHLHRLPRNLPPVDRAMVQFAAGVASADRLASGVGRIPQAATVSRCLGRPFGPARWFLTAVTDRIALLPR